MEIYEDLIEKAQSLLADGEDHRKNREFSAALESFNSIIELPIEDGPERNLLLVHAYTCRGAAFAEQEQYDDAIDDFSRAIQINPEHSLGYYNRAMAWEAKGNADQALDDYTRLLNIDPEFADARVRREQSLSRKTTE